MTKALFLGFILIFTSLFSYGQSDSSYIPDPDSAANQDTVNDVVITYKGDPLVNNSADKIVYNAAKDITAQGGVATDLLKKIPSVSVDADGNVDILGQSNVRFLINGKNSAAFGDNVADVLKSIPASEIQTIEVMSSPGSKQDADGTGGVINIILKKNAQEGIHTTINGSLGTLLNNGAANVSFQKGKLGLHAFVSGDYQYKRTTNTQSNRNSWNSSNTDLKQLSQSGNGTLQRSGVQTGLGMTYNFSDNDVLTANFGYIQHQVQNNNDYSQNVMETVNESSSQTFNSNTNHHGFHTYNYLVDYKHTFNDRGAFLDLYYNGSNNQLFSNITQGVKNAKWSSSLLSGLRGNNPGHDRLNEWAADYSNPINDHFTFEAGLKLSQRSLNSIMDMYSSADGGYSYAFDNGLSSQLNYKQNIYAGYINAIYSIGNILDIHAGLRFERTNLNAQFSGEENISIPNYNTIVPSISLAHQFNDQSNLTFSLSKRIQRPKYQFLNPSLNVTDPQNITQGNPNLSPEKALFMQLSYNKSFLSGTAIGITAYWRHNTNDIQPYTQFYNDYSVGDTTYSSVAITNYQNIGKEDMYGLNLFGSVNPINGVTLRSNVIVYNKVIQNAFAMGNTTQAINYKLNISGDYVWKHNITLSALALYNSRKTEVQGKYPSLFTYTFSINKMLWNKNASIGITTTNPFGGYINQITDLAGTDFTFYQNRKIPMRSFGVNFSWKFGNKLVKEKNERKTEED